MTLFGLRKKDQKGFSLIELSLVLVIVGMMLTVGVGVMTHTMKSTKMSRAKANLGAIKNSLISYALARGRLPCPDTNGDGSGNCTTSGVGELPYIDLSLSSAQKDIWGLPYRYDTTNILTTTNNNNFCITLYQLDNLYNWYGKPNNFRCNNLNIPGLGYRLDLVCTTTINDGANNGRIASPADGYPIAAYVNSMGEDNRRGGKNRNNNHEYEMGSNPYDATAGVDRDDIVEELSFSDLSSKVCNAQNTSIDVKIIGASSEAWLDASCSGTSFAIDDVVTVLSGQNIYFNKPTPTAPCSLLVTFEELARCNVDRRAPVYTGTLACNRSGADYDGNVFDGRVSLDTSGTGTIKQ